jgi:hypothetical protein
VGVSYSDHYPEQHLFGRLMTRLQALVANPDGFTPVISAALRC